MDKHAILDHVNAVEAALYSALVGGGSFGTVKLLQAALNSQKPKEEKERNTLDIRVPQQPPEVSGMKVGLDLFGPDAQKVLGVGVGLPAGFLGAKMLYDTLKKKQVEQETAEKEKQYLQLLSSYKTAAAKEHVNIDNICYGLIAEMEKAGETDPVIEDIGRNASRNAIFSNLASGLNNVSGGSGTTLGQALALLTGVTALGVGGGMIYHDRKKKENAQTVRAEDLKVRLV